MELERWHSRGGCRVHHARHYHRCCLSIRRGRRWRSSATGEPA